MRPIHKHTSVNIASVEPTSRRYPISVRMFHILGDTGVFAPDQRLELIDGEIIEMSPIGSLHARCVNILTECLTSLLVGKFRISVQNPVILNDESEPQPDLVVLRYRDDFYKNALPGAGDVILMIEVSESTIEYDRTKKIPRYAAAAIKETWLVNLESDQIEVHSEPKTATYGIVKVYQRGETVRSETIPELELAVDDILG